MLKKRHGQRNETPLSEQKGEDERIIHIGPAVEQVFCVSMGIRALRYGLLDRKAPSMTPLDCGWQQPPCIRGGSPAGRKVATASRARCARGRRSRRRWYSHHPQYYW
jgi:hypothetical protein